MLLSLRYLLSSTGKNKCGQPPVPKRYGRLFLCLHYVTDTGKHGLLYIYSLKTAFDSLRILKINIKWVDFFGEKRYNNKLVGKEV